MNHDELVKYIRRGIRKGFNTDYLRAELLKHGHDSQAITKAINHATGGPQKERAVDRLKGVIGILAIVLVIMLAALILSYSNQQEQITILQGQVDLNQETAKYYLSELDRLGAQIQTKEQRIQAALDSLDDKDQSPEVKQLVTELKELHEDIKEERKQTRNLLWELLNQIIERGNLVADQEYSLEIENGASVSNRHGMYNGDYE